MKIFLYLMSWILIISAKAQDYPIPVAFYKTAQTWSCDTAKEVDCGTFSHPQILRITPINCPDSLIEEFVYYDLIPMTTPTDTVRKMHKIPTDRNAYFVNKGDALDSFYVNLSGTLLKFTKLPTNEEPSFNNYYKVEVAKEGVINSFHLDINIPGLNMIVDRNLSGNVVLMYRTNKINKP